MTPTEVATSSEILLEAHGVREHALDEQALGRLQMEQPDIEEEQEVLDSTLESFDDQNDDHETSLFDELKGWVWVFMLCSCMHEDVWFTCSQMLVEWKTLSLRMNNSTQQSKC